MYKSLKQDPALIEQIKSGAIGVLPTDTVYGVVALAADESAVGRLYQLKHREKKPGTLIAASIDQLVELGLKARYLKAVEQYWPNPLTIIIPTGPALQYLQLGVYSLAVRIPSDEAVHALLEKTGPLLTSSANHPGELPANTIAEAQTYFDDKVDFYVDGGDLSGREASTIIRMVDDAVEVLRAGSIKIDEETGSIIE
jgi:L-threonylcarbamoyladenylate synthase